MEIFITAFSLLLLLFTLLPLTKNAYWAFRIFDYPRLQKFTASCICLALILFGYPEDGLLYGVLLAAVGANAAYLLWLILPFTPLWKKQVLRYSEVAGLQSLSIMIANVYQENRNYAGALREIQKADPDVVLLLETDDRWDRATAGLSEMYPHHVKVPLENTYGMLLYSRLVLEDFEIRYMVQQDIPSIHARLLLPGGQAVQLYALHPTPPVPSENTRSSERDKELLLVADLAKASRLPVIVIGDLNDVAWSYTTNLFLKMSGLLDPRRGRGFYNSFHAHYPFLRFPLDHAFISTDFKLKRMCRLKNFDSDHFPIYISVQYEPAASLEQEEMVPDTDDIATAQEKKAAV